MIRSSMMWFVLLGVACAAEPVDNSGDSNGSASGATSGGSGTSGSATGGTTGSSGSAGTISSTGGSLAGSASAAGTSSVSGSAGKGGGGTSAAGGTGGTVGGAGGGGASGTSNGGGDGTAGAGGSGRIDQKDITTHYMAIETGTAATVQHIYGQVQIVNMGGGNAYLKDTRVRYYFTNELAPTVPQFEIQLHQLRATNLTTDFACTGTLVKMPTPTATADTYIEFTFPNDPQVLDDGKTAIIQFRIFDPMPTQPKFLQSNDYSFNAQTVATDKIPLYYKTNIIWGNEPE